MNGLPSFFNPAIHEHHLIEEKFLYIDYKNLGDDVPSSQTEGHHDLIKRLDRIAALAEELLVLIKKNRDEVSATTINEKSKELITEWKAFTHTTREHLSEEEIFWPPIIAKHGEKVYKAIEKKIVDFGLKNGGEVFQLFGCGIAQSMGAVMGGVQLEEGHVPWTNPKTRDDFLSAIPYPVRKLLMPGWNRKYQRYKVMITSIAGDVDVLHVQDAAQNTGCHVCTIA